MNLFLVPFSQNLSQNFLKNSSIDFFPKLIQEKKFSNIMQDLTIFVEEYKSNGVLKGIYIKEKIGVNENKIILAREGKLIQNDYGYSFKLLDGKITNIDDKITFNLGFEETVYDISKLSSKTRKEKEVDEVSSLILLSCLEKFINGRKNNSDKCGVENQYFLKEPQLLQS